MAPTRTYADRPKPARTHTPVAADASLARRKRAAPKPRLTQLHLAFDNSPHKTCPTCALTYTRGVQDDEALHKAHCARVQRGLDWGRGEEKDAVRAGVQVLDPAASPSAGVHGRIIVCRADAAGKVGTKLAGAMHLINTVLAAPPLSQAALKHTKAYLFLVKPKGAAREQIAACVLAHRISTALAVLPRADGITADAKLVHGLYCSPDPLPTPLGISRVFVALAYRRKGIARALLDAAARTAIHACTLDARAGEIAFSQPTDSGRQLMDSYGVVRVYEEDEDDHNQETS